MLIIIVPIFIYLYFLLLIIFVPRLAPTLAAFTGMISVFLIFLLIYFDLRPYRPHGDLATIFALFYLFLSGTIYPLAKLRSPRKIRYNPDAQILVDYELYGACFSFEKGLVVDNSHWDLKLSSPSGLASNNAELNEKYKQGGIYDLGLIEFAEIKQVPKVDTLPALSKNDIVVNHCYLVKTSSGQKFAKIQITKFNPASMSITFRWQLADDSGSFINQDHSEIAQAVGR